MERPSAPSRAAALPGLDHLLSHAARLAFRPALGDQLSARRNPAARDLVRHALADLRRNPNRARAWAKAARRWPAGAHADLLDAYGAIDVPTLLLWADADHRPALAGRGGARLIPDALLRVLPSTGFLMAYDDPVVSRGR